MREKLPLRRVHRARRAGNARLRWWRRIPLRAKAAIGLIGPTTAVIGVLLGLGVIHSLGGGGNAVAAAAS